MVKVITYGTYDLLHMGHIRLLERAKALGDYLIVGVTADDFDKKRGKINIQQSLIERIEGVKSTGLADEIIVEEYPGQKIDDIRRYDVDIFTVGSDWEGKFDYLNEYCKVVYLERTRGVSSSKLRSEQGVVRFAIIADEKGHGKFRNESMYVNGLEFVDINVDKYAESLNEIDAIYIGSEVDDRCYFIKKALEAQKNVLCELPISSNLNECKELFQLAKKNNSILMPAVKTAYSTAYSRLLLLAKSGEIGNIVSVDVACTSLIEQEENYKDLCKYSKSSLWSWGPIALLPIFQLLGVDYEKMNINSIFSDKDKETDTFTKIDFKYSNAVASLKVGNGVKSEGELIISGTRGYIYVPAPWWKTDYFEIRYENPEENKRQFYQLDGEGIRYELVVFLKAIKNKKLNSYVEEDVVEAVTQIMEEVFCNKNFDEIVIK